MRITVRFSLQVLWVSSLAASTLATGLSLRSDDDVVRGDKLCSRSMCVTAIVNGSVVEYVMSSTSRNVGWMAIGFGRAMGNSPMIIMWPNGDGSTTLSQRSSHGHSTPTLESSPPRIAEISQGYTTTSGSKPQLAFRIPTNTTDTKPYIIWAYSSTNPHYSAIDASIDEHSDMGEWQLDLTRTSTPGSSGSGTTNGNGNGNGTLPLPQFSITHPLYPYQRLIVIHAVLCFTGFAFLLPAGALLARYLRVFNPIWFKGHWIIQFGLAGPVIVIGVVLGFAAVQSAGALHLGDKHRQYGFAILAVYIIQLALGAFIHFIKNKNRTRRPLQNYLHGLLGLITIGAAMYQIYDGFHREWSNTTGRGVLSGALTVFFWVWVVLVTVGYLAGLFFLPRQLRQENNSRLLRTHDDDDVDRGEEYIRMISQPDLSNPQPQTHTAYPG